MLVQFLSDHFQYSFIGILYFLSSLWSFFIGAVVLHRRPSAITNRAFFLTTFSSGIWLFCYSFVLLSKTDEMAYFWMGINYTFAVHFISPSVFLFSDAFVGEKKIRQIHYLFFGLAFILAAITPMLVRDIWLIKNHWWGRSNFFQFNLVGNFYFYSTMVLFILTGGAALIRLWSGFRNSQSPQKKAEIIFFAISALIGYTGSVDFLIGRGLQAYPFGFLSFGLFITLIAYRMLTSQFLETSIIVKRISVIFVIYVVLILLVSFICLPAVKFMLRSHPESGVQIVLFFGLLTGVLLSTGPFIYAHFIRNNFWLRGHVTTGLTHELKSPLSSIQGAVDIILRDLKNPERDISRPIRYAEMIEKNAERLEFYVQDLLNLAKIQEDEIKIEKELIDLSAVLESVIAEVLPSLKEKKLILEPQIDPEIQIEADVHKMRQVFSNLLSNAIKYSKAGLIKIVLERKPHAIQFLISDQGIGLTKQQLPKIFDRFYQVDSTMRGSGIGLTITQAWIEAHNGKIWSESEGLGKGSTFKFIIPTEA